MIVLAIYIAIGCWIAAVTVKPQGTVAGCVVRTLAAIWLWPVVMLKAAEWPFFGWQVLHSKNTRI